MSRVLVVDGSTSVRESVRMILAGEHDVLPAASPEEGAVLARGAVPDLVLAGGPAGTRRRGRDAPSPWLDALRGGLPAEGALRLVSLPLPFGVADLRGLVRHALAEPPDTAPRPNAAGPPDGLAAPRRPPADPSAGAGRAFREMLVERVLEAADPSGGLAWTAARARATTLPVLLLGERGTGRETLARWIHEGGPLAGGPLVVVSCSGLAPGDLAARLQRAAARVVRPTLLVEELDEASPALQRALLELLRSGAAGVPAEDGGLAAEVRPIASASDGLFDLAERGLFAEPLIEALAVLSLPLPPLRERPALVAAAAAPLLARIAREAGHEVPRGVSPAAIERLATYLWPGNLRELAAVLARSAALAEGPVLGPADIDFGLAPARAAARRTAGPARPAQAAGAGPGDCGRDAAAGGAAAREGAGASPGPDADARFAALAAELAHELKNPLVAIKTFTQLLAEKFDDPEFRREFYHVVRRDVERIDHLVEGVLHAAGTLPREARPVDLNGLIEEVLARSEPWMVERRVVTFKELAEPLPPVLADPGQVRVAVFNVVARALASLPAGEDLFIATRPGPRVQLVVAYRDQGLVGTARPAREAEELELALARAALGRDGGRLAVRCEPGQRTVVTLELPGTGVG